MAPKDRKFNCLRLFKKVFVWLQSGLSKLQFELIIPPVVRSCTGRDLVPPAGLEPTTLQLESANSYPIELRGLIFPRFKNGYLVVLLRSEFLPSENHNVNLIIPLFGRKI